MKYLFKLSIPIVVFFGFNLSVLAQTPVSNSKHIIEIRNMKFIPSELIIKKGDTVVWINRDFFVHNITEFDDKRWKSSNLAKEESWSKVINENLNYYCSLHVTMKGKLTIE